MTTGRGSEPVAQCRSCAPISMTSALDFSSRTVARRTVQTLIGSNVALSTSTRPPLQRLLEPSESGPCRGWSPNGTDPSGPGGTAVATERSVAAGQADFRWDSNRAGGSLTQRDRAGLAGQREADRLLLLGRELVLAAPAVHLLAVQAR